MSLVEKEVRFDERGLVPAVVQEASTGEVLMVAYMNRESLAKTLATGYTWFYSRSRDRLWQKGESSGHVQRVVEVRTDCDQDTILVKVEQVGPGACHEGYMSCFHYRVGRVAPDGEEDDGATEADVHPTFDPTRVYGQESASGTLELLYDVIASRKARPVEGSYTTYLFNSGVDKILKKVGEESTEVIIAGKGGDTEGLVMESADLLYHLLVLFVEAGLRPDDVWSELAKRRGGGGSEDAPPGK